MDFATSNPKVTITTIARNERSLIEGGLVGHDVTSQSAKVVQHRKCQSAERKGNRSGWQQTARNRAVIQKIMSRILYWYALCERRQRRGKRCQQISRSRSPPACGAGIGENGFLSPFGGVSPGSTIVSKCGPLIDCCEVRIVRVQPCNANSIDSFSQSNLKSWPVSFKTVYASAQRGEVFACTSQSRFRNIDGNLNALLLHSLNATQQTLQELGYLPLVDLGCLFRGCGCFDGVCLNGY
eukprot:6479500-Amphidinium_carterae.1